VYSSEDLPLQDYLATVGVELNWRSAEGQDDRGGKAAKGKKPVLSLGARTSFGPRGLRITRKTPGFLQAMY